MVWDALGKTFGGVWGICGRALGRKNPINRPRGRYVILNSIKGILPPPHPAYIHPASKWTHVRSLNKDAFETKLAAKSLHDFMLDLKVAGDSLDAAKEALQSFVDGPQVAFHDLRDFKTGDFDPKVPEPVVETQEATQETVESPSKKARTEETPA